MALKTFVKVGNITNLSDARYCAGMGVDILGFCFDKNSDQYINPESYKEIVGWLSGPKFVGEFESMDVNEILDLEHELNLDYIQVNDIDLANKLCNSHSVIYREKLNGKKRESLKDHFAQLSNEIKYILIESDRLNDKLHHEVIELSKVYPVLRGYDLHAKTVVSEILRNEFVGISINGSLELKPGLKEYDELADILEALDDED
jgi:phosphoribosylanthranilate isomerase